MRSKIYILFGAALCIRLLFAFLVWTPLLKSPDDSMSVMYMRTAHLLAAGLGHSQAIPGSPAYHDIEQLRESASRIGRVVTEADGERIDQRGLYTETLHPPGWALVAAGTHRITQLPIWLNMQILAALLDAIACVLLFLLVRDVLGKTLIAYIAAGAYAVFPALAYEAAGLEPMGMMSFFAIASTLSVVRGYRASTPAVRWRWYALAGVVIGLGAYFRPDILLIGPFFGLGLMWAERKFWRPVAAGTLMLVVPLVLLLPWAGYTQARVGKPVFTSTALGVNLVNGLGEYPNPWDLGGSDTDRVRDAIEAGLPHAFVPEADTFFRSMFMDRVAEHPAAFLSIMAKRVAFEVIATPHDWGILVDKSQGLTTIRSQGKLLDNVGYIIQKYWFRLLSAGFMFVCFVSSIVLFLREGRESPLVAVLLAVPVYYAASHIPIHMEPRYLLPGAFALFVGFAYVSDQLATYYAARKVSRKKATA